MAQSIEDKSRIYNQLMYDYDQLSNKIADIKSENFELSPKNERDIFELKKIQNDIMLRIQRMM
jgi:hypothetical protein